MPETRYARSGDVHIAYQVSGQGPPDVVFVPGFISNVELAWEVPFTGPVLRRVGSFARVVAFDKRGTGLSDRTGAPSLEQRMDDVRAVMDEVGMERAALWGISEAGPMCILFAATYPDRTSALILQSTFARIMQAPEQPFGYTPEQATALLATATERWGTGEVLTSFFPSAATDPAMVEILARYERNGASPSAMADIVAMAYKIDVRHALPTIQAPTIVIHSTGDSIVDVAHGRYMAEHIPGARYIELSGVDHLTVRQSDPFPFEDIEEFLTGHRPAPELERVLKTVMFTDIVSSTKRAVELGDQRWKRVLDDHDAVMRGLLDHYRGIEVDTAGDGFLASFDGPARAVRCAVAATQAVRPLGIEMRAGVHTGECIQRGTKLGGIGVHIGARVAALAGVGQVLVSRTVTDLVAGSGLRFADEGEHRLKGVPEPWQLFSVVSA